FTKVRFKYFTLKEKMSHLFKRQTTEKFWALRNINFKVREGETLGIIGANGAGKSTLLKVISGIMEPDEGNVLTKGKISTLLQLGAGFKPELSGRENIYINASLLGYSFKEIKEREQQIIEYSELGSFIDSMLKFYSSGMKVRLGFSVATAFNPDILIIDEVLAVGDESFKEKCYKRFESFQKANKTVIVVSHGLALLNDICNKLILLDKGKKIIEDEPNYVIGEYLFRENLGKRRLKTIIFNSEGYDIYNFKVFNENGEETAEFNPTENFSIQFDVKTPKDIEKLLLDLIIYKIHDRFDKKVKIYREIKKVSIKNNTGKKTVKIKFKSPISKHGEFSFSIGILEEMKKPVYHILKKDIKRFEISLFKPSDKASDITLQTEWEFE
ncbi:ATP-binding cassette domain-containing protein, partial [Candidatus Dependentiae bacterium]|nr:ATP-binding cassette domain-containing protein [Candidatus Dependentiae bacterium]